MIIIFQKITNWPKGAGGRVRLGPGQIGKYSGCHDKSSGHSILLKNWWSGAKFLHGERPYDTPTLSPLIRING